MILVFIIACLTLGFSSAVPVSEEKDNIFPNEYFYKKSTVIYTGQYDIVKIHVPFNNHNVVGDIRNTAVFPRLIFFTEANVENGKSVDKGLYVLKNGIATKLLDNGRDAAANNENIVYFGASDGIYKYNEAADKAEKHGTVTDDIIQLAHSNKTNVIYYLTDKHEVYKLNDDATTSVKVPLEDVQSVVFDFFDNMYYNDSNKNFYVVNQGVGSVPVKIEGLPSETNYVKLISSMINSPGNETLLLVDDSVYRLKSDATFIRVPIKTDLRFTAAAPQLSFIQYFAKDKNIYQLDLRGDQKE